MMRLPALVRRFRSAVSIRSSLLAAMGGLMLMASGPAANAMTCENLVGVALERLQDAPVEVISARSVPAKPEMPEHCRVAGYVWPQIGFEILLPTSSWNEKFIEVGCGGFCGQVETAVCADRLRRGYACIASDMGHKGRAALWAHDNLQARVDFGFRTPHVVAIAGKAIAERYFGRPPRKSYFQGCSQGGREAMVEAQRFPTDFDGIIAGAPPINYADNTVAQLWNARAALDENGRAVLSVADAKLIHGAALAQCDMDDGVRDGVVGNPAVCKVDLASLSCQSGSSGQCLSARQIQAVTKLYEGPPALTRFPGGGNIMPGSELNWHNFFFSSDGGRGRLDRYAEEKLRYLVLFPDPDAAWKPEDWDFQSDPRRLAIMAPLYSATNPDLREFQQAGGKLLIYQGWNDHMVPPLPIVDYYSNVGRIIGSRAETQAFVRLFMVPGMNHCFGGEGAWAIDYLSYLEDWVEKGQAPDKLIAGHIDAPAEPAKLLELAISIGSLDTRSDVTFTRPVFPYPLRARYRGKGNVRDAENFVAVSP